MSFQTAINNQTLAAVVSQVGSDPSIKAQLWLKYLQVGSRFYDAFAMFESTQGNTPGPNAGKNSIINVKNDLKAIGGDQINFSVASPPAGPGVIGETMLKGAESKSRFKTWSVQVDWHRDAVSFTKKQIHMMAAGGNLEQTIGDLLREKMGVWKQNDMMMALLHLANGNIYRPNNRADRDAIGPDDKLSMETAVAAKARLNTIGAKPISHTMGENGDHINGFLLFASEYAYLDIRNDPGYQNAIQLADDRGKSNSLFTGKLVKWQGQCFYEHIVADQDWDDYVGAPIQPKAVLGVAFGANDASSATCVLKGSASNPNGSKYFQFFPGYAYRFTEDMVLTASGTVGTKTPESAITPLADEYYAWIVNPDGTVGFIAYNGGHDGKTITVTKILNPDNTADQAGIGQTTVGGIVCSGDFSAASTPLWGVNHAGSAYVDGAGGGVKDISGATVATSNTSALFTYTSSFDVGAVVIPANKYGVPIFYGFVLGAQAACRAYGKIDIAKIKDDDDYGMITANGYEMVFGQAPTINTAGITNGYLVLEFAGEHEGYPVPSVDIYAS